MGQKPIVFLIVLGYGQVERTLNLPTQQRIRRALKEVQELEAGGKSAILIFTSGNGCGGSETLASGMERFVLDVSEKKHTIIVNKNNPEVWGTVLELQWAWEAAKRHGGCKTPELGFITNGRHGRRIRIMNRFVMKIPNIRIVESDDPPSCWYHEVLAYGKIALYITGMKQFIARVENFRRRYYTAG